MSLDEVAEEIKATFVEGEFTSRWVLVETYHKVGAMILQLEEFKREPTQTLKSLSVKVGRSDRVLWWAVKFNQTFKRLDDLPEGKNVSMHLIIRKYLTDSSKTEEACHHEPITICKKCREVLKNEEI